MHISRARRRERERTALSKHSCVSTKLYYNRNAERRASVTAPPGCVVFAYTDTATPGHDGCLYEAVIYFIIGGRGRYNPRLGNEAIHEE